MTGPTLAIGELASATGVTVSTLRHYDEVGVLEPAGRVGGKRHFSCDDVGRVNFIRRAQRFGFSLAEIRHILNSTTVESHRMVDDKLLSLRAQQVELAVMITMLEKMKTCDCSVIAECPSLR